MPRRSEVRADASLARAGRLGSEGYRPEKVLIREIQLRTPLVETYIQDTRPDVKLYQVPIDDQFMLSRVDFGKGFFDKNYSPRSDVQEKLV